MIGTELAQFDPAELHWAGIWHMAFSIQNAMPCQGHAPSFKNQPRLANHYAKIVRTKN